MDVLLAQPQRPYSPGIPARVQRVTFVDHIEPLRQDEARPRHGVFTRKPRPRPSASEVRRNAQRRQKHARKQARR